MSSHLAPAPALARSPATARFSISTVSLPPGPSHRNSGFFPARGPSFAAPAICRTFDRLHRITGILSSLLSVNGNQSMSTIPLPPSNCTNSPLPIVHRQLPNCPPPIALHNLLSASVPNRHDHGSRLHPARAFVLFAVASQAFITSSPARILTVPTAFLPLVP